jgi:uncharacterized membrane protein YqiK
MDTIKLLIILAVLFGAAIFLALVGMIVFRRWLRIPDANEALIIIGKKSKESKAADKNSASTTEKDVIQAITEGVQDNLDMNVETSATWVNPLTSSVSKLKLDSRSTVFSVECHDISKISVSVRGVILYKVGDAKVAIKAAARRFLTMSEDDLNERIKDLVTGQVRALVGGTSIPELINNRQVLMEKVRESTYEDMAKLGLQIDSLTIQDISDSNGYIDDLGKPQAEEVRKQAAIAEADARQESERASQEAQLKIAEAQRDTEVKRAEYKAEEDKALEISKQAGPLAKAEAQKDVVAKETEVAELQASMREKQLNAEVRKTADAEAYRINTLAEASKAQQVLAAEAEAEATKLRGQADAEATKLRGKAQAEAEQALQEAQAAGIKAKGEALEKNGDAFNQQLMTEQMPAIASAVSEPFGKINDLTIFDGPEGLSRGIIGAAEAVGKTVQAITGSHNNDSIKELDNNAFRNPGVRYPSNSEINQQSVDSETATKESNPSKAINNDIDVDVDLSVEQLTDLLEKLTEQGLIGDQQYHQALEKLLESGELDLSQLNLEQFPQQAIEKLLSPKQSKFFNRFFEK